MRSWLKAILMLALSSASGDAKPILQSTTLKPGDQYRLIFFTSTTRDATSTNVEDYNDFVQSVADSAPAIGQWGLEWAALASTETVDARDNTHTNWMLDESVPIYRLDGQLFVDSYKRMYQVSGSNSAENFRVEFTELGIHAECGGECPIFTGTGPFGTASSLGALGGQRGVAAIGFATAPGSFAYVNGSFRLEQEASFYAISEVITVVPEPSQPAASPAMWIVLFGFSKRSHRNKLHTV